MSRPWLFLVGCLVLYVVMMAGLLLLLVEARRRTIAALDSPQARAQWEQWRAETRRQSKTPGPANRRVPNSQEPPGLILLRDHFPAVAGTCALVSTCLFVFLAVVFRGAFLNRAPD